MPRFRADRIAFLLSVLGILALTVALLQAYSHYDRVPRPEAAVAPSKGGVAAARRTIRPQRSEPTETTRPAERAGAVPADPLAPTTNAKPEPIRLTLSARRGDCWIEARAGSAKGRVLYLGTLERGKSIKLGVKRLWIRFGAPHNLDLILAGQRHRLRGGPLEVIVTRHAIRPAT